MKISDPKTDDKPMHHRASLAFNILHLCSDEWIWRAGISVSMSDQEIPHNLAYLYVFIFDLFIRSAYSPSQASPFELAMLGTAISQSNSMHIQLDYYYSGCVSNHINLSV